MRAAIHMTMGAFSLHADHPEDRQSSINQSIKCKTSYIRQKVTQTKQHTTPDELDPHNLMPANHMDTPCTGQGKHFPIKMMHIFGKNKQILELQLVMYTGDMVWG